MAGQRRLTGLDIHYLVRELSELSGRTIKKVYAINEHTFSLTFYPEYMGAKELLIDIEGFIFLTDLKWSKPLTPPTFVMALRKHLEGRRIEAIRQLNLERVLHIELSGKGENRRLVVELFGGGNLILAEDNGTILLPLRGVEFRDRIIKRGEIYSPPKGNSLNPKRIHGPGDIERAMKNMEHLPVWKFLMGVLGIGPPYSDEILQRFSLDARMQLSDLSGDLKEEVSRVLYEFLTSNPKPVVYLEDDKIVNFSVFPLSHLGEIWRETKSISEAIQSYYTSMELKLDKMDPRVVSLMKEIERQELLKEEYVKSSEEMREIGDLIYMNLSLVEEALQRARKGEHHPSIKKIDRAKGIVVIDLGKDVEVALFESATGNASRYYEKAKKLREKLKKMDGAIASLREKLRKYQEEAEKEISRIKPVKRRKLRWYERFRWFYTSSGLLVVGGRDAQTNMELVSRYLGENDLFFHVDLPGGAAIVLKTDKGEPDDESILQAAIAAASFSRAWREGLSVADVYYVKGSQVSRHAPPGLYLPKGSFYISGKRSYLRVKLVICVGFQKTPDGIKLTAAPPGAPMLYSICLKPGPMGKEEAARRLKDRLEKWLRENFNKPEGLEVLEGSAEIGIDELVRIMPPGRVVIVE